MFGCRTWNHYFEKNINKQKLDLVTKFGLKLLIEFP